MSRGNNGRRNVISKVPGGGRTDVLKMSTDILQNNAITIDYVTDADTRNFAQNKPGAAETLDA